MFETDDDDFVLSPSSKLSAIFNTASTSNDSNASLTYKAPKQPKPSDSNIKAAEPETNSESQMQNQSSVILANVITLWKLDNGQNLPMGKYMVALIGNSVQDIFEIIIYQDKTNIIIRQTLGTSLTFYRYPNNFVAFYDSRKQLWNLSFDSSSSKDNFLENVCKYKCVIVDQKNEKNSTLSDSSLLNDSRNSKIVPNEPNKDINSNETSSKEKILSRITKMGQSILPRTVERKKSSRLSDSETESSYSDSRSAKPVTAPRKSKRNLNNHEKALASIIPEANSNFTPYLPSNSNFFLPNNQMILNPHSTGGVLYSQPMPDYGLSNFIIAQNAELKANLAEINLKLNNVMSPSDSNGNNEDFNTLTSKIKCHRLKIDNLSTDLERSRKELEETKRRYKEKCEELVEERSKQVQVESIEVELNTLKDKVLYLEGFKSEVDKLKAELKEKDKQIEIQTLKLKDFEEYYHTNVPLKENLTKENNDLKLKLEEVTLRVNEYEEEIKQKDTNLGLKNNESVAVDQERINKIVKESMNEAFISIMEGFDENEAYGFKDIRAVLLQNLKNTSYRLINSLL